jgi:hypothetical protein
MLPQRLLRLARLTAVLSGVLAVIGVTAAAGELTIEGFGAQVSSTDAGSHPDVAGEASLKSAFQVVENGETYFLPVGGTPRDVVVNLPAGLVGDPKAVPQCPPQDFFPETPSGHNSGAGPNCPAGAASEIGTLKVAATIGGNRIPNSGAVYLLSSGPDAPARLGYYISTGVVGNLYGEITASVQAGDNYAITLTAREATRFAGANLLGARLTIWGVPAYHNGYAAVLAREGRVPVPFIRYPTDCSAVPLQTLLVNTYEEPETFAEASSAFPQPTDCTPVPFWPSISVRPRPEEHPAEDTLKAGVPTGMTVELTLPQNESPSGRGTSDLKEAVLTFPPGVTISPAAAAGGLQACTDEEFARGSDASSRCPAASLIGEDELETPLLPSALKGKAYLGQPLSTDPQSGKMFRIFQEFHGFGVDVKLEGEATADPVTGQLQVRASNLPQQPFTHFRVHTRGGPNAVLVNQSSCGPASTTATLTPYSRPGSPATPSSSYATSYDGHGAPCPPSLPFAPTASVSTGSPQAGALTPVTVTFSREDGMQPLGRIEAHLPPGLLGYVSAVSLCEPPDAEKGTCPAASRIGAVSATAGPGSDPLTVPGSVYLARGTDGYPFALSVVVPAVAGPYDLGNVIALVNLRVNNDGSLTAISAPLQSIIDGVPTDIRSVTVTIDQPGFTFNPTNCSPLSLTGLFTSLSGTLAPISAPFQVSGCQSLPFHPSFTAATQASVSKANGESLTVRVSQIPGEANLQKVKVELPKAMPSRLTTLQKACTEQQFASNPAGCPPGSIIGTITAYTPLLNSPLRGPAYFVSHGGAKFPELVVILQGEGVTVQVAGETFISKTGITSSTFNAIPDVPVSGFLLMLPEGPYSALAVNGNPCKQKLIMPTTITGQNGVVIKQATRIAVSGCPKAKAARKARVARRHKKKAKLAHRAGLVKRSQGRTL